MPHHAERRAKSRDAEAAFVSDLDAVLAEALNQVGFVATLKLLRSLKKRSLRPGGMVSVHEGVVEKLPCGGYDAALQTEEGPLVLRGKEWSDRESADPQLIPPSTSPFFDDTTDAREVTADELVRELSVFGARPPCSLICLAELTNFEPSQHQVLLPVLWQYILDHRNSNERDELIAVGAAIRKYIALMPMGRMGDLAVLLESGHRSPLPIELEIEVAKMIYRNFEVHPPVVANPQPELARRLWDMVQAYINPRVLLHDKHSAATSCAIEAIVSMRSDLAEAAWQAAVGCPYLWFSEMVSDHLKKLEARWSNTSPDAAAWLRELRNDVLADA